MEKLKPIDMNIKYHKAITYGQRLSYIKTRMEAGLTANEVLVSIPTEQFVELAEAYIELYRLQIDRLEDK